MPDTLHTFVSSSQTVRLGQPSNFISSTFDHSSSASAPTWMRSGRDLLSEANSTVSSNGWVVELTCRLLYWFQSSTHTARAPCDAPVASESVDLVSFKFRTL